MNSGSAVSRRALLRGAAVGTAAGLAGCGYLQGGDGAGGPGQPRTATYTGRVTDLDGNGLGNATVAALVAGTEPLATTTTDGDGRFELAVRAAPVWLRARHPDHVTETRAAGPAREVQLTLTPDEGTLSLAFGGDVMFGRRFYAANDDPLEPQARIRPDARREDHRAVLQHLAPLFDAADVTSVNLETPLTEVAWRHPSKEFTFTSHPVAAEALAGAGVDYTALGNNHVFDALRPGLRDTLSAVESAGLAHSGAGTSSDAAWAPATVERGDTSVAFVSCTTIAGREYDIDWSADATGRGPYTVEQGSRSITFGDDIGAAEASEERIARAVERARAEADLVVVGIHGDDEYVRTPTDRLVRMVDAAADAGADLVVNHHPHVTGGIERRNGALVAWTLGNLVFDQELWETLRSYALVVHATDEGVQRAYTQPLVLDGYVPVPATGTLARRLSWETAGLSADDALLAGDGRRLELGRYADAAGDRQQRTQQVDADGAIYTRTGGWVADVADRSGTVLLGRDRLFAGTLDRETVDGDRSGGALWRFSRDQGGWRVGYRNSGAVRLNAFPEDTRRSLLSPASRIPVGDRPLALTARYRYPDEDGLSLLVSWYNAAEGVSIQQRTVDLPGTDGEWRLVTESLEPPAEATYVNLFCYLDPGETARRASIDDLRLVEWAPPETTGGRAFDHLLIDGSATLALNGTTSAPADWERLDEQ